MLPMRWPQEYIEAIEFFARESAAARRARLIESIRSIRIDQPVSEADALVVAQAIDEVSPEISVRTIFVDVSAVSSHRPEDGDSACDPAHSCLNC